jgi:hypothetical protein
VDHRAFIGTEMYRALRQKKMHYHQLNCVKTSLCIDRDHDITKLVYLTKKKSQRCLFFRALHFAFLDNDQPRSLSDKAQQNEIVEPCLMCSEQTSDICCTS